MKRFLLLCLAIVATSTFGVSTASAQGVIGCGGCDSFNNQYGYDYNRAGFERPPYFALFPPVYYSDQIVRRPMGISPFAVPPGVLPVEMTVPAEPQHVVNPYFNKDSNGESATIEANTSPTSNDSDT